MYSILIHISGISILEILFYFIYIGPFESAMFKKSFRSSLESLMTSEHIPNHDYFSNIINKPPITNISNYNITDDKSWDNYIYSLEEASKASEQDRLADNDKIFVETMIYWTIFFASSLVLFLGSTFYDKYHKKNKNLEHKRLVESTDVNSNKKPIYKYLSIITHYSILAILIVIFEYLFFQYVVLKYKIMSNDELKYLIMDEMGIYFYNQY